MAQKHNYIPNGSFEFYERCPDNLRMLNIVKYWFEPNEIPTSEYFNACDTLTELVRVGVPLNIHGYQHARTGVGYIGFFFYLHKNNSNEYLPDYREYASVVLNKKLTKDVVYKITAYFNLANGSTYYISKANLQFYFSNDSIAMSKYHTGPLPFQPQVIGGDSTDFVDDTLNWTKITGFYKAKGGEKYLTLGNFNNDGNTPYRNIHSSATYGNNLAYYYIDDVSLYEADTSIALNHFKITENCQDNISFELKNTSPFLLDFSNTPLLLNLEVEKEGKVIQSLQQILNDNSKNPEGKPLEAGKAIVLSFPGLTFPEANTNYNIKLKAEIQTTGENINSLIDTTVFIKPYVDTAYISSNNICRGDSIQLQYKGIDIVNMDWEYSKDLNHWDYIGSGYKVGYLPTQNGYFRLSYCNFYSDTFALKIKERPDIVQRSFHFCAKGEHLLNLNPIDTSLTINWYTTPSGGTPLHQGFEYLADVKKGDIYYLEIEKDGCYTQERSLVKINLGGCALEIPNVFTPNGDGVNDVFKYGQAYGKDIHTVIYNRWGKKIKEFSGNEGWDGKDSPAGVYYYTITLENEVYKGTVTLIR